jgi:hypothetical protein
MTDYDTKLWLISVLSPQWWGKGEFRRVSCRLFSNVRKSLESVHRIRDQSFYHLVRNERQGLHVVIVFLVSGNGFSYRILDRVRASVFFVLYLGPLKSVEKYVLLNVFRKRSSFWICFQQLKV